MTTYGKNQTSPPTQLAWASQHNKAQPGGAGGVGGGGRLGKVSGSPGTSLLGTETPSVLGGCSIHHHTPDGRGQIHSAHQAGQSPQLRHLLSLSSLVKAMLPIKLQGNVRVQLTRTWPSSWVHGVRGYQKTGLLNVCWRLPIVPTATSRAGPLCCLLEVLTQIILPSISHPHHQSHFSTSRHRPRDWVLTSQAGSELSLGLRGGTCNWAGHSRQGRLTSPTG